MANIKNKIPVLEEMYGTEEDLAKARADADKLFRDRAFEARKKQEEAMALFVSKLNIKDLAELQKKQKEFLKEFEKIRLVEAQRFQKSQEKAEKQRLVDFYKESSKLSQQEDKRKVEQLKKEEDFYKKIFELRESGDKKSIQKADMMEIVYGFKESFKDYGNQLIKGLVNISDRLGGEVNSIISTFSQYQSTINTRLQGTATTFQSLQSSLTRNVGIGPFVRTSSLLENLNSLVAQGIAFNLEQRAFLETISDKIATTFDVADASLLRIVKLQQQDSSASRLGMEAYLTRYFNEMFQDTAYLSQTFDSVTAALVEATSQMGAKQSVEFEYVVQKWLGSLSAVGTSENTIRAIAETLGYLGSGNVSALSGSSMQNLLVMAASRAGLDYSSILTEGLNAYNTNTLLQAVVGYMQEIGQSGNKVVKSQFAQTFGISMSDLQAASNLNADLNKITANMMSYSGSIEELGYQLNQISTRTSIPEMIQTLLANVKFGIGQGIAENPVMAALFELSNFSKSVTGGIKIPDILALGSGVMLNTTVEGLLQSGIIGLSAISKLGDVIGGIGRAFDMASLIEVMGLGGDVRFQRGAGLAGRATGMTTSQSLFAGSASGGDIAEAATLKAKGPAEAQQKKAQEDQKTSNDIFNYLVYMLDPKLVAMTQLLGVISGANNVSVIAGSNTVNTQSEYIMNYGSTVRVAEASQTNASKSYNKLEEVALDVSGIHQLLKDGITVNVANSGSLASLSGNVSGFTQ